MVIILFLVIIIMIVCECVGIITTVAAIAYFGTGDGNIWLDDVGCVGTEESIFDCPSILVFHNCNHFEDVGLRCFNDTPIGMYIIIKTVILTQLYNNYYALKNVKIRTRFDKF